MRRLVLGGLAVLCLAPTAGDVGGCGSEVTSLDVRAFAFARKDTDCRRCQECSVSSARCVRACDAASAPETTLPDTCKPVDHDGEVCIRALRAASCEAFATYLADVAPKAPSECEFCKIAPPAPSVLVDGGR